MMKKCDGNGIETKPIAAGWVMIASPFMGNNMIIVANGAASITLPITGQKINNARLKQ